MPRLPTTRSFKLQPSLASIESFLRPFAWTVSGNFVVRGQIVQQSQLANDALCVNVVGNGSFPFGVKRSQEVTPSLPVHLGDPELGLLPEAHASML